MTIPKCPDCGKELIKKVLTKDKVYVCHDCQYWITLPDNEVK